MAETKPLTKLVRPLPKGQITLPVEFNASRRGLQILTDSGMVAEGQMHYARNVLTAASLTYITVLAQALAQVMYYVYLLGGRRRRRR